MRIDTFAYSNRWRTVHPGEKGLFVLLCLIATLLSNTTPVPLVIAVLMSAMTLLGAGIPWETYLRLITLPVAFIFCSCLALALSFSGGEILLAQFPTQHLTISLSRLGVNQAQLAFTRSLGATSCLLFLALTTPMTEIMVLLRSIGVPKLLVELMTITYRQLFIFLEIAGQIRAAQEARLGYSSTRLAIKSLAGLAGNVLMRSLNRAHRNHQGLLARGYDAELMFLSPCKHRSFRNLTGAATVGTALIILALVIQQ